MDYIFDLDNNKKHLPFKEFLWQPTVVPFSPILNAQSDRIFGQVQTGAW
jgi:hypothetical protein